MDKQLDQLQATVAGRVSEGKMWLLCELSEAELLVRGDDLADAVKDIAAEEEAQTAQRKAMRDKLAAMRSQAARLAQAVKDKAEKREVLVVCDLVSTAEGEMVRQMRSDTREILFLRKPTARELQSGIKL